MSDNDMQDANPTQQNSGATPPMSGAGAAADAQPAAASGASPTSAPSGGAPQASPAPAPIQAPPAAAPPDSGSWGHRVLNSVVRGLGGGDNVTYVRGQDGKMAEVHTPATPGQSAKNIIANAVVGAIAGAGAKGGPGQTMRGFGAGGAAVMDLRHNQKQENIKMANDDFDAQQKVQVQKAQLALINQQLTESSFHLGREKVKAQFDDIDRENEFAKSIQQGGEQSKDLGVISKPEDGDYFHALQDLHKDMPDLMKQQANGNIIGIPHVNKAGEIDGMHYALVTPEWKGSKLDHDEVFYKLTPPDKGGTLPKVEKEIVKAGTMNNGDFWTRRMAAEKEISEYYMDQWKQGEETKRTQMQQAGETQRTQMKINADNAPGGSSSDKSLEKSYNDRNAEIKGLATPIDTAVTRLGRLQDSLRENTPQADALVAPELLTVMAGGQGSGLRMNEAEISRIIGGRSKWEDLRAAAHAWSLDPSKANSITPSQRTQIRLLTNVVEGKLLTKQTILQSSREQLAAAKNTQDHKDILVKTHAALNAVDEPPAAGYVRILASDKSIHDVPSANLEGAKKIDPNLRVLE